MSNTDRALAFERVFCYLKKLGNLLPGALRIYTRLQALHKESDELEIQQLIHEVCSIQYGSNTNAVYYFYFPIVSHILHYKPEAEGYLLKYLVGPNFANGSSNSKEMVEIITKAMYFKLEENADYCSKESKDWVLNQLPNLEAQINREIAHCWKELED